MTQTPDQLRYRALSLLESKQYDSALSKLNDLCELTGISSDLAWRAKVYLLLGHYQNALNDYMALLELEKNNRAALYNIALIRSSCPLDRLRNGKLALEVAKQLVEKHGHGEKRWRILSVPAAAHAECGEFESAAEITLEILGLIPIEFRERFEKRLMQYNSGEPYRATVESNVQSFENIGETCVDCGSTGMVALTPEREEFRCVQCASYSPETSAENAR